MYTDTTENNKQVMMFRKMHTPIIL